MAKVFISYASTDPAASGLARLIHNRLLRLDLCKRFEEEWPRLIELLAQTAPTETAPTNDDTPEKAAPSPPTVKDTPETPPPATQTIEVDR